MHVLIVYLSDPGLLATTCVDETSSPSVVEVRIVSLTMCDMWVPDIDVNSYCAFLRDPILSTLGVLYQEHLAKEEERREADNKVGDGGAMYI